MAEPATKDTVERGDNGPDYEAALELMRGEIHEAQGVQSAQGMRAGRAWKKIEKQLGLNRRGAQMFNPLLFLEQDVVTDILRTFLGLLKASKLDRFTDLVDQMGASALAQPPAKPAPAAPQAPGPGPEPEHPLDDSDLAQGLDGKEGDEGGGESSGEEDDGGGGGGGGGGEEDGGRPFDPQAEREAAEEKLAGGDETSGTAGGAGFDERGQPREFMIGDAEWDAGAEAAAAKAAVGDRPKSPVEQRKAKGTGGGRPAKPAAAGGRPRRPGKLGIATGSEKIH